MSHPPADSAGQPWAGRSLTPPPFPDDDGTAAPALAAALAALAAPTAATDQTALQAPAGARLADLVAVLGAVRLLVPVVAVTDESSADMALPRLRAPDGRAALPVFSSTAALAAWDDAARPVPVDGRRVALSAVDDGCDVLVLDPAGPAVVVPRPAVWAVAQGRRWTPSPRDPAVAAAVAAAAADVRRAHPALLGSRCEPGGRTELRVVLRVAPGLGRAAVRSLTADLQAALAASEVVAERVDSLELRLVAAPADPADPAAAAGPADPDRSEDPVDHRQE